MTYLTTLLRNLFRQRTLDREMREEMQLHLERATERLMARGMSREDAYLAARREFGNVAVIQEEGRDARGARWIETTRGDLRYAARSLRRSPVFTISVVISLALGIGANTAVFGIIHSLMLARLPITHPEQLVQLRRTSSARGSDFFWNDEYRALRSAPDVRLAAFTGWGVRPVVIGGTEERDVGEIFAVDGDFFSLIGVVPEAGRLLARADDSAATPAIVISHDLAVRRFSSAADAIGGTVMLNRMPFTIVGVTPRAFRGLMIGGSFALAMPVRAAVQLSASSGRPTRNVPLTVIGRALDRRAAQGSIERAFQGCCANDELAPAAEGRVRTRGQHVQLADVSRGIPAPKLDLRAEYSRALFLLMAGVAVLLLIACANIGNLLLARAAARTRELAVRLSLGASRWRVLRQLLIESLELAIVGAALGLAFAVGGTRMLASHMPSALSRLGGVIELRLHLELFAFTAVLSVACAALFGIIPAIRATRLDAIAGLRDAASRNARRPGRLDHGIVAVQVALALVLVTAAGLLAATLSNLRYGDGGFESAHMLIGDTEVRGTRYEQTGIRPLYGEMLRRVRALPGVRAAGMGTRVPIAYGGWSPDEVRVPGYSPASSEDMHVDVVSITPGYLDAVGIPVRRGRDLTTADREGSQPVAIVTESFAKRYFGGRDPVGARFSHLSEFGVGGEVAIVGVAGDAKYYDLRAPVQPMIYVPFEQTRDWGFLSLAVRTASEPEALVSAVHAALGSAAPGVTVRWVQTMDAMLDVRLAREMSVAWLATLFAGLAVMIAALGLYGVQAYQVAARTSEIGIRMALGAEGRSVVWMVLRRSFVMVAAGGCVGVPLAIGAGRAMGAQLYGVAPWHPSSLGLSLTLLSVVAVVASLLPAARAARVDPLVAIRAE